jgi:uncharacterized protein YjbI with pentapeptide repeats
VNPDHLELLKAGADAVQRHAQDPASSPLDFSGATVQGLRLDGAQFYPEADFSACTLVDCVIVRSTLERARFDGATLSGCALQYSFVGNSSFRASTLEQANLGTSNFASSDFTDANLARAMLGWSSVRFATFDGADLRGAIFQMVDAHRASMRGAQLEGLDLHDTVLTGVDFTNASGLDRLVYRTGSAIDYETVARSGELPRAFYEGVGLPDEVIAFFESTAGAIRFYSAFISYSAVDQEFADRIYADLQAAGVRCWLATEDLKIGEGFRQGIDDAIRVHDKLLLVLSEHSVNSAWVESEVEAALERERREDRTILFPIRLDDAVMEAERAWAAEIRRTRYIGDFRGWKDYDQYTTAFERLVRDLKRE